MNIQDIDYEGLSAVIKEQMSASVGLGLDAFYKLLRQHIGVDSDEKEFILILVTYSRPDFYVPINRSDFYVDVVRVLEQTRVIRIDYQTIPRVFLC